jgi:Uncharacterised protein family (UPF0158)
MTTISLVDLESAFDWVSASAPSDNAAYISKATGEIFYSSEMNDVPDEVPEDCDDNDLYWSVPHKNALDLGRALIDQFVSGRLPDQLATVRDLFQRRGAYGRYKDLLSRNGKLDEWFAYEQSATRVALLAWAKEQRIEIAE